MDNVAIITARGGSKRIPRKNIKLFRGRPIIAYSIETALKSQLFDYVIVSTDDEDIAEIAKQYGAQVPFLRSKNTSDDFSTTAEVIMEVLTELEKREKVFVNACCIYPTAPFITTNVLQQAHDKLIEKKLSSVFPVCAFSYPVQRALQISDNYVSMVNPENLNKRSQDLPARYHDAGQFYWLNVELFKTEKKLFTNNSGAVILDELSVQDIDNETDWKIAELKYALLNSAG